MKAGLDLISNQDLDGYSAETYVNGVWRDIVDKEIYEETWNEAGNYLKAADIAACRQN